MRYIPAMFCNLLSITQVTRNGFEARGKQNWITLTDNNICYGFDGRIQSGQGILLGLMTEAINKPIKDALEKTNIKIKQIYIILEHPNNHASKTTALSWLQLRTRSIRL